jgi:iron complex transport system substrate-binding protein
MFPDIHELAGGPRRIVALAPSITETLFALGEERRLVGVTRHCTFPEAAKQIPRIGGFQKVGVADVIALEPDLVIGSSFLHRDHMRALVEAEIRVWCQNPTSLVQVLEDFVLLGRLVEREAEGRAMAASVRTELLEVAKAGRALARRPRVYAEEWGPSDPLYMVGDWAAEMVTLAGGDNVFADRKLRVPSPGRVVTAEDIVARDPDVFVAAWCGMGENVSQERILRRPGFAGLRLARDHWIRVVDDELVMRPGPRLAEGARRMHAVFAEWAAWASGSRTDA